MIASSRKQINFPNNKQAEFVHELRREVKQYFKEKGISRYGNRNMVFKTIFMLSLYFTPYILMVSGTVTQPWILALLWIMMGLGMAGIGLSIMHDANHGSYSKNKKVNRVLAYTLNLVGGFTYTWQYQHNTLHHSYTNIEGHDDDINPGKFLRLSPGKPRYKLHKYQHIYGWLLYGLMTVTWTINKDFKQMNRFKKEGAKLSANKSFGKLMTELIATKVIYYLYVLVIPILVLPVPWWTVLIFYLSMHFVCGVILGVIFQTAHVMPSSQFPEPEENGTMENNWAIHQLLTTTNYSPKSRFFSWFIGGLNYQVEHHLFPNICHVHYKKISTLVKNTAEKHNLPYFVQPTFTSAIYNHWLMLRSLGKAPVSRASSPETKVA